MSDIKILRYNPTEMGLYNLPQYESDSESDSDDDIDVLGTIGKAILYNGIDIREIEKDFLNRHTYINHCDQNAINTYLFLKKRNNQNIDIIDGQQYSCQIRGRNIHIDYPPITSSSTKKKSVRKSKKSKKRKSVRRKRSKSKSLSKIRKKI